MKKILVIGSLNMDYVINVEKRPEIGETVLGKDLTLIPGGKGANQAYTAGNLGADVTMLGALGNDSNSKLMLKNLTNAHVNVEHIEILNQENSGCAFINVDSSGDNNIIVIAGANNKVDKKLIDENLDLINNSDSIILQLEIPLDTVIYAAKIAHQKEKLVILDPAPANKNIPKELWQYVDIVKPNETEIQILTNRKCNSLEEIEECAKILLEYGAKNIIVSLGNKGSLLVNSSGCEKFETLKIKAIDTTAAGDSFTGALATSLAKGKSLIESIRFAHIVSAIVCTKKGAQSSIPNLKQIMEFINKQRIIIDSDPGVDDLFAILLALNSFDKLNIEGITTVAGNCSLENATRNALKILELNKSNVNVYKGSETALVNNETNADYVHGNNGMGGIYFNDPLNKACKTNAIDYIINTVNASPKKISLICIGPLTNLALAIKKDPSFVTNIKEVVIMGGTTDKGNVTPYAEFNFYKDPEAASIVFNSNIAKIVMVGLNVTTKLPLNKNFEQMLREMEKNDKIADFIYKATRIGAEFDRKNGYDGLILNDPLTIAYLIDEKVLKLESAKVKIDTSNSSKRGRCIIEYVDDSNCYVATSVNSKLFYRLLFERIFNQNLDIVNKYIN